MKDNKRHVVVIGGGFAGLSAVRALRGADVSVTLVDRRNYHLFQPLLYQAATGLLCASEITSPLRHILRTQDNVRVLLGEVTDIDPTKKIVSLADGELDYDSLIVAAGMENNYFGNDAWERHAPGLKTVEDTCRIRQKIFMAFEIAERETDPEIKQQWLNFAVIGAGATGIELSGMISEITRNTLKGEFRSIRPEDSNVLLIDAADRILPAFAPELSEKAQRSLERLGVSLMVETRVVDINNKGIHVLHGAKNEFIPARTVLWATGVKASPLGKCLADRTGAGTDTQGRVFVNPDLTIDNHPDIFVIGDMAHFETAKGMVLPGLAPVATQQGRYVARTILGRVSGMMKMKSFRYFDKGMMAVIGRKAAVADIRKFRFSGFFAWFLWLFVHLFLLIQFENKLIVFLRWAFQYFRFSHGARQLAVNEGRLKLPITNNSGLDDR